MSVSVSPHALLPRVSGVGGVRSLGRLATVLTGCLILQHPNIASAQTAATAADDIVIEGVQPANGSPDSVVIRLVDVELKLAVQALARFVDRPVLFTADGSRRITLDAPAPVPRERMLPLLRGLVESHGLAWSEDSAAGLFRVHQREAPGRGSVGTGGPAFGGSQAGASTQPELFVLRLRHARASDVAATVNSLYGRASALGELGLPRSSGSTSAPDAPSSPLSPPTRATPMPPTARVSDGLQPNATPAPGGLTGRPAQLLGEVTIVPDPNSNALLIRASRPDFELIRAAVEQLDVRPLQVLIEVVIAEVRRDRSLRFGVEATVFPQEISGLTGGEISGRQEGIGLGDFALRILRDGPGVNFDATLRASAARGDARILSRPVVLATNGEAAEILVGSQRPFVLVQRSLPTDAPQRDQVVQYRDVGTRLLVRPTISADGYVSLAITQEVNAATAETQFDAPIISTRTVQTVLLVRDSQTVVLGGLSDQQREVTQSGVPLLSSIPLLGGIFGRASRRSTETEFFLFLRPRIVASDADAESVTVPYRRDARLERP